MHSISLQEQKTFSATDVKEIGGFSEKEVTIITKNNERITIMGENLNVEGFSKSSGAFSLTGKIKQIKYQGAKESLIKKIFK